MTEWLEDAFGPDGVRVTVGIEQAVERLVRERDSWTTPDYGLFPHPARNALRNASPAFLQSFVFKDRWAVVVEADSGQRLRLTRPTRDEALAAAHDAWRRITEQGVPALSGLT